jgi:hypothetical protein
MGNQFRTAGDAQAAEVAAFVNKLLRLEQIRETRTTRLVHGRDPFTNRREPGAGRNPLFRGMDSLPIWFCNSFDWNRDGAAFKMRVSGCIGSQTDAGRRFGGASGLDNKNTRNLEKCFDKRVSAVIVPKIPTRK